MNKDFKMAHIVPVAQFGNIANNHYHMCLAHLVYNDVYANFYKDMAAEGKYVLMDNGAAEKSQLNSLDLINMYARINPTEIVLPDTLNDGNNTIAKTFAFVDEYYYLPYRFMAVPQGKDFDEWKASAKALLRCKRINSIGISKFLNIATCSTTIRIRAVQYIEEIARQFDRLDDIEIHLLGCDEGPALVNEARKASSLVRGCDSAFVYIAAKSGMSSITNDTLRPEGEIDFIGGYAMGDFERLSAQFDNVVGAVSNTTPWKPRVHNGGNNNVYDK